MKRNSRKHNNYSTNVARKPIKLAGKHSILSALNNRNRNLHYLITNNANHSEWKDKIDKLNLKLDIVIKNKEELDKLNNYKPHQNVILVTDPLERLSLDEFLSNQRFNDKIKIRLILLDEVTDPQNVGAIIRSALAFNMDGLALSQKNSPPETSALTKASSGAIEKLQIIKLSNMSREIKKLQKFNFSIYGLDSAGEKDIHELEKETGNVALILGSESKGLRRLTRENVDSLIKIPINGETDSLNVSNAASVAMYQLQKNIIKN